MDTLKEYIRILNEQGESAALDYYKGLSLPDQEKILNWKLKQTTKTLKNEKNQESK